MSNARMVQDQFVRLEKIVPGIERCAEKLAVSLGNFHGTNDFALTKRQLINGFVLDDIQRDQRDMVIVRTAALFYPGDESTDATLTAAAKITRGDGVREAICQHARAWSDSTLGLADSDEQVAVEKLSAFLERVDRIDASDLSKYRHFVLAHSTTKTPPDMTYGKVRELAEEALAAADDLAAALGHPRELVGVAGARREQSLELWLGHADEQAG